MSVYNLVLMLSSTALLSGAAHAESALPITEFSDCSIPQTLLDAVGKGVQFAINKQAAFFISGSDLDHAHLLISQERLAEVLKRKQITALELMGVTDAILLHSQEHKPIRDLLPVEVRKRRNIFVDLRTQELKILDVGRYPVDPEYYTIWQEEDLGFLETFQVTFEMFPHFLDLSCQLPSFSIRYKEMGSGGWFDVARKVVVTRVMLNLTPRWNPPNGHTKDCLCSGAVIDF